MNHNEFQQRWREAVKAPKRVQATVAPRPVELSMETVVDRYIQMLEKAVAKHRISQQQCDEVCQQAENLKTAVRKIDPAKIADLQIAGRKRHTLESPPHH